MRGGVTQTLTAVRAAAALCAHSQGGYLGERIRGERTALRQAVLPNGTRPSSTVSSAVMRRLEGVRSSTRFTCIGDHAPPHAPSHCAGSAPLQPRGSIGEADQLFLADIERIRTAFAAPSKVAATETVQPFSFGSFTAVRPFGASGFESVAVLSPAVMATSVTVFALALTTVTAPGGPFVSASGLWLPGRPGHPPVLNPAQQAKGRPSRFAPSQA